MFFKEFPYEKVSDDQGVTREYYALFTMFNHSFHPLNNTTMFYNVSI